MLKQWIAIITKGMVIVETSEAMGVIDAKAMKVAESRAIDGCDYQRKCIGRIVEGINIWGTKAMDCCNVQSNGMA